MTLDQVISDIVYNKDVHNLLKQPDLTQPYGEIVQYQIDECVDNDTSIDKEGFQIGEPFDGDIENAPILFLSSNPAFNFDEVSPRYFAASGKVFNPEHISATKRVKFSDLNKEYSFEEIKEMFIEPQKEMSFDEIKDFFKTRIQTSPARNDKDQTLRIPLKDGGTICVPYWTCVKNNTELLLPDGFKGKPAREIMKSAVCMEVVPFRSNTEEGVTKELLEDCWSKFTKYLLELSVAPVIVLVGKKALNMFTTMMENLPQDSETVFERKSSVYTNSIGKPEHDGIVNVRIGKTDRLVVKVDSNMGKFSRFGEFFTPPVIAALQNAVASSPFVQKALQNPVSN